MLNELKFVQGAVARKDLIPGLTHFRIQGGRVTSYNGKLAISCPIALDIDCIPKAGPMIDAISNCADTTMLSLTPAKQLRITSGPLSVLVPTLDGETPHVDPEGVAVQLDGAALLTALRILEPFVGNDASRLWTNGVLFDGQSAYATNNTCLVQYWIGSPFPHTINVPREVVKEILRIGEPPTHAQLDANSITFHYTEGRWIRSQLLDINWPMAGINAMLDVPSNAVPIDPELFKGLGILHKLVDGAGRVYLKDGALRTSTNQDEGATYELTLPADGCYNMKMFGLLEGVVTSMDMTLYPEPCLFFGDRLRGAIIGMRM